MPLSKLQELKGHHVLEVKVVHDAQNAWIGPEFQFQFQFGGDCGWPIGPWSVNRGCTFGEYAGDKCVAPVVGRTPAAGTNGYDGERGWSSNVRSGGMETFVGLLTFYISWAGGNLSPQRRRTLERAKDKLRDLFGARR